jgi:hypothetical protein
MNVVGRYREAVGLVLRPLEVGQVDRHFVADIHFDGFRRDVRTDQGGKDFDLVALLDRLLLAGLDRTRMRLVGAAVGVMLADFPTSPLRAWPGISNRRYALRIVSRHH